MLYVSFVEILGKSVIAFTAQGYNENDAYMCATGSLFSGMVLMKFVGFLVHALDHNHSHDFPSSEGMASCNHAEDEDRNASIQVSGIQVNFEATYSSSAVVSGEPANLLLETPNGQQGAAGLYVAAGVEVNGFPLWKKKAAPCEAAQGWCLYSGLDGHWCIDEDKDMNKKGPSEMGTGVLNCSKPHNGQMPNSDELSGSWRYHDGQAWTMDSAIRILLPKELVDSGASDASTTVEKGKSKDRALHRMGLNTALAISIHNFPEGLATFVATLANPSVGVTLAVAIAIHNIPEGLCVALPIFYSTGNRHRAFLWAILSGVSEPIGALIGYGVIKSTGSDMNQLVYGILFGVVAGMMIAIVILELFPTSIRYDPSGVYVSNAVFLGMFVMACSLLLFLY